MTGEVPFTYTTVTPAVAAPTPRKRVIRRGDPDYEDDENLDHLDDMDDDVEIPEDDDDDDWLAQKRRRKPYIGRSERKSNVVRNVSPYMKAKLEPRRLPTESPLVRGPDSNNSATTGVVVQHGLPTTTHALRPSMIAPMIKPRIISMSAASRAIGEPAPVIVQEKKKELQLQVRRHLGNP